MGINEIIKVGNNIKKYRKLSNLTQIQMAYKLKIPRSTYANYENNTREPNTEMINKIAKELNVSINNLIENKKTGLQELIEDSLKFEKFESIEEISEKTGISLDLLKNYEAGGEYSPDDFTKVVNATYGSFNNYRNQSPHMIAKKIAEEHNKQEGSINDLYSLLSRYYRMTHNPTCVNNEYIEVWLKEGSNESMTFTKEEFEKFIEFVVMSFPNFKLVSKVICNNNKE